MDSIEETKFPNDQEEIIRFIAILQLTKQQPLTGYTVSGIKQSELPNLASHHYTTAVAALLVCRHIVRLGGKINPEKIVAMLLVHDLGELFGGDISTPLNRAYPELREYKNKIGDRAVELMSRKLPGSMKEDFLQLYSNNDEESDERWVAKIFDQMDHQFFLEYYNYGFHMPEHQHAFRDIVMDKHICALTAKIQDPITKDYLINFLQMYKDKFLSQGFVGLNELLN